MAHRKEPGVTVIVRHRGQLDGYTPPPDTWLTGPKTSKCTVTAPDKVSHTTYLCPGSLPGVGSVGVPLDGHVSSRVHAGVGLCGLTGRLLSVVPG